MTFKLWAFFNGLTPPFVPPLSLHNSEAHSNTSTLSISSSKIKSCAEVVEHLKSMGLKFDFHVLSNITYHNKNIENGCQIVFVQNENPKEALKHIWNPIQKHYNLNCAHLHIPHVYNGCILNYLDKQI